MLSIFKTNQVAAPAGPAPAAQPVVELLEDILLELSRFGQARLHQFKDGEWSCAVDANITPIGAKFEVRSEFTCKTPTAAAVQCRERLHAAIKALGQTV